MYWFTKVTFRVFFSFFFGSVKTFLTLSSERESGTDVYLSPWDTDNITAREHKDQLPVFKAIFSPLWVLVLFSNRPEGLHQFLEIGKHGNIWHRLKNTPIKCTLPLLCIAEIILNMLNLSKYISFGLYYSWINVASSVW